MNIAGHEIGSKPFTIAEVGLNHNGDLTRAIEMIRTARACGVTAVKFQTFKAEGVCDSEQDYTYHSQGIKVTEKRINIFRRAELPDSAWPILKAECDKQGVVFLSTPQNPSDLDTLLKVGIPAIKIGSDDLTNLPMLRYCSAPDVALPIILSTGMCTADEIDTALQVVGKNSVLLCCTSEYPCPPESSNLLRILKLRAMRVRPNWAAVPVGFSDHTTGSRAATVAVGLGACVLEKHFTLNHQLAGPDHWWSANPSELAEWVTAINEAHTMLGDGVVRPSAAELEAKAKYQRTEPA